MHPDWEDSEGRFDPNRMSLLTGVIGFDYAVSSTQFPRWIIV